MKVRKRVRIGVIGCGAIARIYHLPALMACPATKGGVVLADPEETRRRELAEEYGITTGVADYRKLVDQVDGVIVATPPTSHYEIAKWFLQQRKHVLCEKPLTESFSEAQELVTIAREAGVGLAVNQTRRFFPSYKKIRELLDARAIGDVQGMTYHDGIEFDWPAASPHHFARGARGAWSDTGIHLLDTLVYWMGSDLQLAESLNDSAGGPEAMATVRLAAGQGATLEIKVSRLGRLRNGFVIHGTQGTIDAPAEEFSKVTICRPDGAKQTFRCGSKRLKYTDFAKPMIENFVEVLRGRAKPTVSGEDCLATIRLLEAAYDQAQPYPMPWNASRLQEDIENHPVDKVGDEDPARGVTVLPKRPRVLVTGASGFLGCRVLESFHLRDVASVSGTLRHWTRAARPARYPIDLQLADIEDPSTLDQVMRQGFDAIVHTAYIDTHDSIVGGTQNLLDAARRNHVKRFIYLSTAEVYGPEARGAVTEETPTPMTGRLYGDAKIEAEQRCREANADGLATTILRPSLIYGPFGKSWTLDIAKRLLSGKWGTFEAHGDGIANLIYVDDLVDAIELCLVHPAAPGETFNVNGPDPPTWNAYFEAFNDALQNQPLTSYSAGSSKFRTAVMDRIGAAADWVLDRFEDQLMEIYLRGGLAGRLMKRIKNQLEATPTGTELNDLFARQATYDANKIERLLGFQPHHDLATGLRLSVQWLALHEVVPSLATSLEDPADRPATPPPAVTVGS